MLLAVLAGSVALVAAGGDAPFKKVEYPCTADGAQQPALFYAPETATPVPLLVALHTWSADYTQRNYKACEAWCVKQGWACIQPSFRGPNRRPEATGSELVVQDILDAVAYAQKETKIDARRVYLLGASGGGYTALLMAGRHPELWAGVTAWVPIVDLKAWYEQCKAAGRRYYRDIAASCGGAPGDSDAVDEQYRKRSPLTWLPAATQVWLDINAGIHDGREGSVPVSHALRAFNAVADEDDRITDDELAYIDKYAAAPYRLRESVEDPGYGAKQPLFRRYSGHARVTVFKGGHEIIETAAIAWLERLDAKRREQ